jgi:hypothetical protein
MITRGSWSQSVQAYSLDRALSGRARSLCSASVVVTFLWQFIGRHDTAVARNNQYFKKAPDAVVAGGFLMSFAGPVTSAGDQQMTNRLSGVMR